MEPKEAFEKLVGTIGGRIYDIARDAIETSDLPAGLGGGELEDESGGYAVFSSSTSCGREAVMKMEFVPAQTREELSKSIERDKIDLWQGFAKDWNNEHPDNKVNLKGDDPEIMEKERAKISDGEIRDGFDCAYENAFDAFFDNEGLNCSVSVRGEEYDDYYDVELSVGDFGFYSIEIPKPEIDGLAANPEKIEDFADDILEKAAKADERRLKPNDALKEIVTAIGEKIYGEAYGRIESNEIPAACHDGALSDRSGKYAHYEKDMSCGRESAVAMAFIPANIRADLKEMLDHDRAKAWESFAKEWNGEHPEWPVDPGDGCDFRLACAEREKFAEKCDDDDVLDEFNESFGESLNNFFDDESLQCRIAVKGEEYDDNYEICLSIGSIDFHSHEIPKTGMATFVRRPEMIDAYADAILEQAAAHANDALPEKRKTPAPK